MNSPKLQNKKHSKYSNDNPENSLNYKNTNNDIETQIVPHTENSDFVDSLNKFKKPHGYKNVCTSECIIETAKILSDEYSNKNI